MPSSRSTAGEASKILGLCSSKFAPVGSSRNPDSGTNQVKDGLKWDQFPEAHRGWVLHHGKRHLDTWRQRQAEQASAIELPSELTEQGNALTRALWRAAQQWAEREVKLAREQAAADNIQADQREQAAALEQLRRLEQV